MRCLINISSAAFLSEMCPLTLLLLLTLTNVAQPAVFHLSWEESGASDGDGEVWARPQ